MATGRLHEDLRRGHGVKTGSNRSFGLVFGVVFGAVGVWPILDGHVRWWALVAGLILVGFAVLRPSVFTLPNRMWTRFGLLLHRIISPLIVFGLYCFAIVPMGLALRIARKDLLRLRWNSAAETYWIKRVETGGSMSTQF